MDNSDERTPRVTATHHQPVNAAQLLERAGRALAAASGEEEVLRAVAELAVPALADFCCLDIVRDGQLEAAVVHGRPAQQPILDELRVYWPSWHALEVARTGLPLYAAALNAVEAVARAVDGRQAALIRALNTTSLLVVPLIAAGEMLGTLSLGLVGLRMPRTLPDVLLAQELGPRTAQALDGIRHSGQAQVLAGPSTSSLETIEARFRTIADCTFDWEFWLDAQREFVYVSPSCERVTGYSAAEFLARASLLIDITHPDDTAGVQAEVERAMAGGVSDGADFRLIRRDGEVVWISAVYQPVYRPEGAFLGVRGSIRDVSDRKRAEQAWRDSEERYRSFVEQSSEAIWRLELEEPIATDLPDSEQLDLLYNRGYVAEANQALARMHGFADVQEALGSHLGQLLPRLALQNVQLLSAFIRSGYRVSNYESKEIDRQGGVRHFANNMLGIVENGALTRLWGVKRDITERKLAEEALRQARDELEMLLAMSGEMTGQLEIESLLNAVAGRLLEIVDYTSLVIFRPDGPNLVVVEYRGPTPRDEVLGQRVPVALSTELSKVVSERRPVNISDLHAEPLVPHDMLPETKVLRGRLVNTARSWLGVPLLIKDQLIGVLRLGHDEPNHFSAHDAELTLAFANHAAIALENARLYERAQHAAALEERQRLARDLHDAVSQTLFSASLTADVLPRLYTRDPVHGQTLLAELKQMNRGALAEMRALLMELRPAALLEVDLGSSLRQLGDAVTGRSRIPVVVTVEKGCVLPGDLQVALYRIAQEALHNVAKHSNASSAGVTLSCTPRPDGFPARVEMLVYDDGWGFDPQAVPANHFGLTMMAERARSIQAAFSIDTSSGGGTRVRVVWPSSEQVPPV